MANMDALPELTELIEGWTDTPEKTKQAFLELKDLLSSIENLTFEFNARPGVSYSLRPKHENQTDRNLFAMVDIIDDDPEARWLSVCFYGDLVTDPEEKGDLVPGGLAGDDGYCFDLDEYDEEEVDYLKARLVEAARKAAEA